MSLKFGEKLRKLRISREITLEALADAVGSSKAYIWQLENKENAKPSADLLLRLAGYFGEAPEFFLDDTSEDRSEAHIEDAFFRKFNKLAEEDKRTIERIVSGFHDQKIDKPK
jgi:transcriptional regulator with XRE-family HTH domain